MKNNNNTTRPERAIRPTRPPRHTRLPRTPDPIEQHATERRLYTDFLALAFYPGMCPPGATGRRITAA